MTKRVAGIVARRVAIGVIGLALVACESTPFEIPRWSPPVAGPIPPAVAERVALPFCGVATNERDPVLRCLLDAWRRRQPVEVGIIAGPQDGNQVGMLRLLPDMTVEMLITRTDGDPDTGWQRATCRTLTQEQPPAIINVSDCTDPVDLIDPNVPATLPPA